MAEIIRAGIESVDKGQMEAARSLGLSYWKAMAKVVLPQAIRTMIPSIINQFIITLKVILPYRYAKHNTYKAVSIQIIGTIMCGMVKEF